MLLDDVLGCRPRLPAASRRVRVKAEEEALPVAVRAAVGLTRVGVLRGKKGSRTDQAGGTGDTRGRMFRKFRETNPTWSVSGTNDLELVWKKIPQPQPPPLYI